MSFGGRETPPSRDPDVVELSSVERNQPQVDASDVQRRRLMWKIDIRIIPWMALLYLLNFLDRGAIGNARVGVRDL